MKILRSFICILVLCAYAGCMAQTPTSPEVLGQFEGKKTQQLPMKQVAVENPGGARILFRVQVADTLDTRIVGLMFRETLPEDEGMVFLFEEEQPLSFWMKNTLIPLDIIYMDKDWQVVSIQKNAQPCNEPSLGSDSCVLYPSSRNAQYVLEINGGLSDKLGITEGAKVLLQ